MLIFTHCNNHKFKIIKLINDLFKYAKNILFFYCIVINFVFLVQQKGKAENGRKKEVRLKNKQIFFLFFAISTICKTVTFKKQLSVETKAKVLVTQLLCDREPLIVTGRRRRRWWWWWWWRRRRRRRRQGKRAKNKIFCSFSPLCFCFYWKKKKFFFFFFTKFRNIKFEVAKKKFFLRKDDWEG